MSDAVNKIATYIQSISEEDSPEVLDHDTKIMSLGYVDSFNVIGILNFLEEEFGIEVDLEMVTIENFDSINSIANLVQQAQTDGAANE